MDIKSILIPVTIVGFILGTVLNQGFKKTDVEAKAPLEKEEVRVVSKTKSMTGSDTQISLLRLKDYMNSLKEKNAFLQQNNELLKTLLDARDKELAAFQAKEMDFQKDMESKINGLQTQLVAKNSEIASLSEAKVNLESQVKELKSQAGVFFTSHAALGNQLNQTQEERVALIKEIDKLKEEVKNQMAANESLEIAMASLTESVKKHDQEKLALFQQLEQLQKEKQSAEGKAGELQAVKVSNESRIAGLERRLDEMQRFYDQARDSASKTSDLYTQTNAALQGKQDEIDSLQTQLLEVMAQRDKLGTALTEKEAQLIKLSSRMKDQEKRNLELVLAIEEKEQGMKDLKRGVVDQNFRWQDLQAERDEARRRLVQMEQELLEQISYNESLRDMVRDLTSDLDLLRAEKESRN
ncbi:MAG: hypothetical protein V1923_00160 [Candidatus Omnitrophota bacterium]